MFSFQTEHFQCATEPAIFFKNLCSPQLNAKLSGNCFVKRHSGKCRKSLTVIKFVNGTTRKCNFSTSSQTNSWNVPHGEKTYWCVRRWIFPLSMQNIQLISTRQTTQRGERAQTVMRVSSRLRQ